MKHAAFFEGLRLFLILHSAFFILHCSASGSASVDGRSASGLSRPWQVNASVARVTDLPAVFHGDEFELRADFRDAAGNPFILPDGDWKLYFQTNGMDSLYFGPFPASASSNTVSAVFSPTNDPGASQISGFLSLPGSNYHAAFRLRFLPSPGATPNALPLPAPTLDFATTTILNPPWPDAIALATNQLSNNLAQAIATKADRTMMTLDWQWIGHEINRDGSPGPDRHYSERFSDTEWRWIDNGYIEYIRFEAPTNESDIGIWSLGYFYNSMRVRYAQCEGRFTDSPLSLYTFGDNPFEYVFSHTNVVTNTNTVVYSGSFASLSNNLAQAIATNTANIAECVKTNHTGNVRITGDVRIAGRVTEGSGAALSARGEFSHAEGDNTEASGKCSHAEGVSTRASGKYSHAEGDNTGASGEGSHAEGIYSRSIGEFSHAEGGNTVARGKCSHAEGLECQVTGDYSHAEGVGSWASALGTYAAGLNAKATNEYSYVWAWNNMGQTYGSHGEGTFNINPKGGLGGFWIGETSLSNIIADAATESDPTVSAWAKAATKPSYTAQEVNALPSNMNNVYSSIGLVTEYLIDANLKGGVRINYSSNDSHARSTAYGYDGVTVKRQGVADEDYLWDAASTNGIVRRKELDGYKPKQTAKSSPSASGSAYQFIDTISQDTNGVITATKKSVRTASTSQTGIVQLNSATNSTSTSQAATPSAVKAVREELGTVAASVASLPSMQDVRDEILIHLATTNACISVSNGVQRIYEIDGTNRTLKFEWDMGFAAISNQVNNLVSQMMRKIEDAHTWANWSASGLANPFQGAVVLDRDSTYFGSTNVAWATSGGFAVMTSHLPASAGGNASQFRIGVDADDWFGMEVTASYLVDAHSDSFRIADAGGTKTATITTNYDAAYVAVPPVVYYTATLSEPFAQLDTGVTWSHNASTEVSTVTIAGLTGTSGFFFLKKWEAGGAIFRSTMPILPEGYRVESNGSYIGTVQPNAIITITQGGHTYRLIAEEIQ